MASLGHEDVSLTLDSSDGLYSHVCWEGVPGPPGLESWTCQRKSTQLTSTWWRHQMEIFSALLAICAGNSPVTGEFHAHRPVTRSFEISVICTWINNWVNNREAGDLRRHRAHYDVILMIQNHPHNVWIGLHLFNDDIRPSKLHPCRRWEFEVLPCAIKHNYVHCKNRGVSISAVSWNGWNTRHKYLYSYS